jgi:hypothetical protein
MKSTPVSAQLHSGSISALFVLFREIQGKPIWREISSGHYKEKMCQSRHDQQFSRKNVQRQVGQESFKDWKKSAGSKDFELGPCDLTCSSSKDMT